MNDNNDLYYDVDQIKTFENIKKIMFSTSEISETQLENLLNDEILFCKILIDLKKISFTIDEAIKRLSIKELNEYLENFYNPDYVAKSKIPELVKTLDKQILETPMKLSIFTVSSILQSDLFYSFLKKFLIENMRTSKKKNMPIQNIDKNDIVLNNFPLFPILVPYIVRKNANENDVNNSKIDIYQNAEFYKSSNSVIRTQKCNEKILFLKSILRNQNKNINIYEYNNYI